MDTTTYGVEPETLTLSSQQRSDLLHTIQFSVFFEKYQRGALDVSSRRLFADTEKNEPREGRNSASERASQAAN